jgi:hypothetical protein
MGPKDLIVTPIILAIIYWVAYRLRPRLTSPDTKRYFIPALTVKIIGAMAVGIIYFYYYGYGDTINYHTHGSKHIWEAFMESPFIGVKLLFASAEYDSETFKYASKIRFYGQMSAYMIVRIAALFDWVTFGTYSATACLFAAFSFSGVWKLYSVFYQRYRYLHYEFSIAVLFFPSMFFWGSGILKDTITIAAIGWAVHCVDILISQKKQRLKSFTILFISFYLIFVIKIYILLCLIPAVLIWIYMEKMNSIRSFSVKLLIAPLMLMIIIPFAYYTIQVIGQQEQKYALGNIGETAKITAYDLAYYTGKDAGSTYTLGDLDGNLSSYILLAPAAINVSLFRPYLWEVKNPFMFLAALESLFVLGLTIFLFAKIGFIGFFQNAKIPIVAFSLIFSIVFAFAVGVSTFNFGTLMRYKIPLIPFYLSALYIMHSLHKNNTLRK